MGAEFSTTSVTGPDTEAAAVAELAWLASEPNPLVEVNEINEVVGVALPSGAHFDVIDLEQYQPAPRRQRGTVQLREGKSLSAYVKAHGRSATALYADIDQRKIVAVLDHHEGEGAAWGDHRAVLTLRHTPEWTHWMSRNGQVGPQTAFAEHIEDGLAEIVEPPAADMLELAQTFQATTKVNFRSSQLLDSGQTQIAYEETVDAKAGAQGRLTIPREFVLGIAPFEGCDPYRVVARLRYRIREGALAIGYVLERPEDVIRTAFNDELAAVENDTELVAYRGTPIAPKGQG